MAARARVGTVVAEEQLVDKLLKQDAALSLKMPGAVTKFEATKAYKAFLGYNVNHPILGSKNKGVTVSFANEFAVASGFSSGKMPLLEKKTVGLMGLKGVQGLNIKGVSGH
jgi:ATP-dependent RNA helicase MSS116